MHLPAKFHVSTPSTTPVYQNMSTGNSTSDLHGSESSLGPSGAVMDSNAAFGSGGSGGKKPLPASYRRKAKSSIFGLCCPPEPDFVSRTILVGEPTPDGAYSANVTRNQKYNALTFLPVTLALQFQYFQNLYFLGVAVSQFIPILRIGFLFTYVAPLVFVLLVSIIKELFDDLQRKKRDTEVNGQLYHRLGPSGRLESIAASDIRVGHLIALSKDQRIPADCVLLRTTEKTGACFIRTDQLDGETDWKLRYAVPSTQKLISDAELFNVDAEVFADEPIRDIYKFVGRFTVFPSDGSPQVVEPLDLENTMWANTVLASGSAIGLVVYTGKESRAAMNTSSPSNKMGLLDHELNHLSKILFALMGALAFLLVALRGFTGQWPTVLVRFMLLFSSIIPISMRVNLELGKTLYSYMIMNDDAIPGTVVRTSTIAEELGRIDYLLSDKTGTLTQNVMAFKKLHIGSTLHTREDLQDMREILIEAWEEEAAEAKAEAAAGSAPPATTSLLVDTGEPSSLPGSGLLAGASNLADSSPASTPVGGGLRRVNMASAQLKASVLALALAHNVTPVVEDGQVVYQASSPDEIALVEFTESVDVALVDRTTTEITIRNPLGDLEKFDILQVFPFTSESKRMGIVVRSQATGAITFYMKGADVVMARIVSVSDWLDEEVGNMAREGLRTLVFGFKSLTTAEYEAFAERYAHAKASVADRAENVARAQESLEVDLDLLCVSGVEDKLQDQVKTTLETLSNANIRIWMLTGDKIETATNIAVSARLVKRSQSIFTIQKVDTKEKASKALNDFSRHAGAALVIDGGSLQVALDHYGKFFIQLACASPAVVCCRCSPTQKAAVVTLIKRYTGKRTAAIGDGGNDVSMIQAADVGIGIVGKEGKQASLAADFSINQFSYIQRLALWHGRNSYKRSARLSQFVIHRGLIIAFIQAVFSAVFYFAAVAIYNGWLIVGYSSFYTMFPVFSLVLDEDVTERNVMMYPELYTELQKGRSLSNRTFFTWVWISLYQAGVIMLMSLVLFENSFLHVVSITFTALIAAELSNVAFEITTWHRYMVWAEIATLILYILSMLALPTYFDLGFIATGEFIGKTAAITAVATIPIYVVGWVKRWYAPPAYLKLG